MMAGPEHPNNDLSDIVADLWTFQHNNSIKNYCVELIICVSYRSVVDAIFMLVQEFLL